MVGMRGLAVLRCNSAATLCPQDVTGPLDCGGGWSNTGNLKNVFEDWTNCFAV